MNPVASQRLRPQDKIVLHEQFSAYMRGESIYPIGIEISPSGICQASCDFCFYANTGELGNHRNVMLDNEILFGIIKDLFVMGSKAITWTGGGEPSLYPYIHEAVDYACNMGLEQGMFTNALSMPKYEPSLLSWVRVTMTDKPYRRDCIEALRPCPVLGFAFNYAGPQDDRYLEETIDLATLVKADYIQVRPALRFHGETVDIKPPAIEHPLLHITDYKFEDARKKHGYTSCQGYHFVPFLWEDGNLDVCGYMRKHEGYTLGNVYQKSLKEILDDAPRHVPVHEQCQVCCKNHEINKAIHRYDEVKDRNFP